MLPFAFNYDKIHDVEVSRQIISEEEAIEIARKKLAESLTSQLLPGSQTLREEMTTTISPAGETVVTLMFENLENIGRKVEITLD
jgi:hypothetical protein